MADQNEHAPSMDYAEHEKGYATFLWLCKWTTIIAAAVLIMMAIFLV